MAWLNILRAQALVAKVHLLSVARLFSWLVLTAGRAMAGAGSQGRDAPMGGTTGLAQMIRALTDATDAALSSARATADALRESMKLENKSALNRLVKTPEVFRHDTHKRRGTLESGFGM